MRIAMIAMTTRSSMSVKAVRFIEGCRCQDHDVLSDYRDFEDGVTQPKSPLMDRNATTLEHLVFFRGHFRNDRAMSSLRFCESSVEKSRICERIPRTAVNPRFAACFLVETTGNELRAFGSVG